MQTAQSEIIESEVHCLDGEFYSLFRAYLEKRGCAWTESRDKEGQLQKVHLQFPPETTYRTPAPTENHERYQVVFKNGDIMNWTIQRSTKRSTISVPYVYL